MFCSLPQHSDLLPQAGREGSESQGHRSGPRVYGAWGIYSMDLNNYEGNHPKLKATIQSSLIQLCQMHNARLKKIQVSA